MPIGEWLPDQAQNENPGVTIATNVLPLTESSYTPFSQFVRSASSALPTVPLSAFSTTDNSGDAATYAGTTTDLFVLTSATVPNLANVSSGAGAYSTPTGNWWSFENFAGSVYASNGSNAIQSVVAANSGVKFATVDANAPLAKCIAAIEPGFLLCLNIVDVTLGTLPSGIRWSALGAAGSGSWPLVGSNAAIAAQSDGQNIFGNIGAGVAIAPNLATCNAGLFFQNAIFRMIYNGTGTIFDIQAIEKIRGTPAGQSVVTWGQIAYFLGHDGFYSFDGTIALPIGVEKTNRFFFADADPNFISQVQGTVDPNTGIIYWAYSSSGMNGANNRLLAYNPVLERFSFITPSGVSAIFVGLSIGIALDNITTQLGFSLDALPFSLDSAVLAGGLQVIGGFDSSFFFGFFTGPNMAFNVETREQQLIPGYRSRIKGVYPLVEGDVVTAAVGIREALNTTVAYAAASSPDRDGLCQARSEGRYARVMLSGTAGNAVSHIKGARFPNGKVTKAGSR